MGTPELAVAVAPDATLRFDITKLFDQWCRSLNFNLASESARLNNFAPTDSEIIFEGVLQVESLVRGKIRSAHGTLVMTSVGRIEADVDVRAAIIDGYLEGTLRATEHVVLKSNARVSGDIHTQSLTVKDGAVFEGISYFLEREIYSNFLSVDSEDERLQALAARA